ncbi:hypothetical protein SHANETTE_159 [Bacillus phage Shanette]|uniref:Uncharacterized protein n=2 Tax=Siminovitchvirus TaxID=1918721 RepID=S5MAM7_9CAUD|nr:head decoration [Bacillus phage JL]YP_009216154.1 head decoration [Bacillus phage Shanette]AGR46829.1 hypothetical protein JL_158 [Bacillus phage JL]AGR47053.1 hypothetical protein SHANETTE_159 [Bacillus phage Shanette]
MAINKYIHDVNAYVEQQKRYGTDSVKVELDDVANKVTVALVDVYLAPVAGAPLLVDETLPNARAAVKFYEEMIHQLEQGDVIRNLHTTGKKTSGGYADNNSRYQ